MFFQVCEKQPSSPASGKVKGIKTVVEFTFWLKMDLHELCSAGPFFQSEVHIYHGDFVHSLNLVQIVQPNVVSVK